MGVCSSNISKQDLSLGCEMGESDITSYKLSGKDGYGQSLVISSKTLNIEDDPTKQYLNLYFEKHKKEIDPKFLKWYTDILKPDPQPVTEVNLKSYQISKKQAKFMASVLSYCPKLHMLNLWDTGLGDAGMRYLTKCLPKFTLLEQLSVEENQISPDGFVYFSKGLRSLTRLKVLSLSCNVIGVEGARSLAFALENCTFLEELYMDNTEIDTGMLEIMSKTMIVAEKLEKVGLAYNKLDSSSIKPLKFLLESTKITCINLTGISITDDEADNLISEFITINIRI